jgi:nitrogen-specific signal transduction histidine kinase
VAASAAKSGFLATMSHEIRTPINAILGYHELLDLEVDGPLTAGQRRHLARARASARHLLELVAEVLDFSRIEADHVLVGRSVFRVGDVVSSALSLVEPQARKRGIELADAVSGHAAGLAVWGDESRVRQVLVNLLGNAVKFTAPREDEAGRVTVSAGTATQASSDARLIGGGPWVYVRVEDTGVGISADQLQPIFEPFVQADMTLTRPHGGTGLGLAISRRLARLMGGDITVRSEEGVGSTFFLWLPAAPVESLQTGGLEGHGPGGEAPPPGEEERPDAEFEAAAEQAATTAEGTTTLRAISDALLAELERVLHAYVARVRSDPAMPGAREATDAQIEDHLASFLADLAGTLQHMDATVVTGEPSASVRDGTAIQRVVSMRHGAQRARLGWSEAELGREFTILREELAAAVRRRAVRDLPGPTPQARAAAGGHALELLDQFVSLAERLSLASFRQSSTKVETQES